MLMGLILIGLSYHWTSSSGATYLTDTNGPHPEWSEEDARELADAAASIDRLVNERLQHKGSSPQAHEVDKRLAAAQQRYDVQRGKLDASINSYERRTMVVRWSGITLMIVGIGGYFVARHRLDD